MTVSPETTAPASTGSDAVKIVEHAALGAAFAGAARRYWITVFPQVRRELCHWHERAGKIPDPILRRIALDAQRKRGNIEGAAAFAAFAPRSTRAALVRALVSFQAAYDYLDVLAEQPQADPVAGARGLHEALLHALGQASTGSVEVGAAARIETEGGAGTEGRAETGSGQPDYYTGYPQREDGGYLVELVSACRMALSTLPSYASAAAAARGAAERIVEFQSLNLSRPQGEHDALARWARTATAPGLRLRWWETAAAGGSPLQVYALIAAAAEPELPEEDVRAIEDAYFPWIGALHSLLDHFVDRTEDAASAQRNLIDYYRGTEEAAGRMLELATQAARAARALPRGHRHAVILTGMAGYYLSHTEAAAPAAQPIARNVSAAIGPLLAPTLLVFRGRRGFEGRAVQMSRQTGWVSDYAAIGRPPASRTSTWVRSVRP
jgi:tetraprenyl-beta-curcumene synthase